MVEVVGYSFFWNVEHNEGKMHLKLVDDKMGQINIDSPEEASLLLDVLRNEKPVYYEPKDSLILTGLEPVGEGEG